MTDKFFNRIRVGDQIFFEFEIWESTNLVTKKNLGKILEIYPTEIKIEVDGGNFFWVKNWQLEYASPEKLLLWKLEN